MVALVRQAPPPVAAVRRQASSLVIEIGEARLRVEAGFDASLLVEVIHALGGAR